MTKSHRLLIVGFVFLFFLGLFSRGETLGTTTSIPTIKHSIFDEQAFTQGITKAINKPYAFNHKLFGAVTPHHMLASHLISGVFQELSLYPPKTIILVGPNHEDRGSHSVITVSSQWETAAGIIKPDTLFIEKLLDQGLAFEDEETMLSDHAVASLLPFLKHFLPNTAVVPLLLKASTTSQEIETLATVITQHSGDDTAIVISTDFSHYLPLSIAEQKDEEMRAIFVRKNIPEILSLNNDYLDSPPSLALLLLVMDKKQINNMIEFDHNNSGLLVPDTQGETTSYFTLGFYKAADIQ